MIRHAWILKNWGKREFHRVKQPLTKAVYAQKENLKEFEAPNPFSP